MKVPSHGGGGDSNDCNSRAGRRALGVGEGEGDDELMEAADDSEEGEMGMMARRR